MQFIDYGDGRSGAANISGTVNSYATCSATAATRTVTTSLTVAVGDQIILWQTQGTGATNWEIVKAATPTSAGSFTTTTAIVNNYSGAQAILVPQYTPGDIGAITAPAWAGSTGAIAAIIANGPVNLTGAVNLSGGNGGTTTTNNSVAPGGTGGGFRGGQGVLNLNNGAIGTQGEGTVGGGSATSSANGNGGGGGDGSGANKTAAGAGGSNGTQGASGGSANGGVPGTAGNTAGTASLTSLSLGGGGGGSAQDTTTNGSGGGGGSGGAVLLIFAPSITITGSASLNGGQGGDTGDINRAGGGGSGGSCLLKGQSIVLGSNLITAIGGSSAASNAGGFGRIAVYAPVVTAVSGTTNPSYDFTADNTLSIGAQGFIG